MSVGIDPVLNVYAVMQTDCQRVTIHPTRTSYVLHLLPSLTVTRKEPRDRKASNRLSKKSLHVEEESALEEKSSIRFHWYGTQQNMMWIGVG